MALRSVSQPTLPRILNTPLSIGRGSLPNYWVTIYCQLDLAKLQPSTQRKKLAAIDRFYRFCERQKVCRLDYIPAQTTRQTKYTRRSPTPTEMPLKRDHRQVNPSHRHEAFKRPSASGSSPHSEPRALSLPQKNFRQRLWLGIHGLMPRIKLD